MKLVANVLKCRSLVWIGLPATTHQSITEKMIGDLVSKETVCCVGGKVKH